MLSIKKILKPENNSWVYPQNINIIQLYKISNILFTALWIILFILSV